MKIKRGSLQYGIHCNKKKQFRRSLYDYRERGP